ncbi:unnamed protein product [Rotaria magnacalcarata]|uniref:F-box domain-containing protein n=1 Tax=Rotaria magnacalcarata TaxID=392030 RepID=A0A816QTZ7_9BILA|nr:unnamed protein product [Rotaria magnacalcarata]
MDINKRKFQETFNSTEYDVDNQTKIMTHQDSAFLLTLPVELVYMIFDKLSDFTIICSLRQVCTRLNMIMDTYTRYQTLTTLDLGHNYMQDEGAQYFADALRNNTTLTTLNLGINRIGNLGAQYLAGALQNNTTLTILNLSISHIENLGAQYLAWALQNNTVSIAFFSYFDIYYCPLVYAETNDTRSDIE